MTSPSINITGEAHTLGKGHEQPDLEDPRPRGNKARVDDSPEPLCVSVAGVSHTFNGGVVDSYFALRDRKYYDADSLRRTVIGRCNSQQGASEAIIGRDLDMLLSGGVHVFAQAPLIGNRLQAAIMLAVVLASMIYDARVMSARPEPPPQFLCDYPAILAFFGWEACRAPPQPIGPYALFAAAVIVGLAATITRRRSVFVGWHEAVQTVLETRSSYVNNPRLLRLKPSSITKVSRIIESTHVDRCDGWVTIRDETYGENGAAVLRAGPLTFGTPPRLVENTDWDLTNTLNKRCRVESPPIDLTRWSALQLFALEMSEAMPQAVPYSTDEFLETITDVGKRKNLAEARPEDMRRAGQVFVKREKVSSFGYLEEGSHKARVVFTRNAYYQREVGRYTKAYSKDLAAWSMTTPHVWTYGWNAEEVGSINPGQYPWAMEGDMSAFDARITTPHLKLELDMYGAVGFGADALELMARGFDCKMQSRIGKVDAGVQRRSGDPNTSLGNSLLNMVITTHILQMNYGTRSYAATCERMLENGTKFFVMGDDIIMVSRTPVYIDFAAEYAKYGLVHKPVVRVGADTSFTSYLSGLFYPTRDAVVWGPQPAAITRAFWYDRSPTTSEHKVRAIARADALNRYRACGFIPVLSAACSRVLEVTARDKAASYSEVNTVAAPRSAHAATDETYSFVAQKLGVPIGMLRDAEERISSAPDGSHVDHEVFDRALASAGKVVDSSSSSSSGGRPRWYEAPCVREMLRALRLDFLVKRLPDDGAPTLAELVQVLRANYYFMSDDQACIGAPYDPRKPNVVVMGPGGGEPFGHAEIGRLNDAVVDVDAFTRMQRSSWYIGAPKRKPVYAPRRNKTSNRPKRQRKTRVVGSPDQSTVTVEFILATLSPSDWSLHFSPREMADNIRVVTLNWDKWQIRALQLHATSHSNAFATGAYIIGWTPDSRETLSPRSYADLASRSYVAKAKARESTTLKVPTHALPKQLFLDDADNAFPYATMGGQFFYRSAGSSSENPTVVELWLKATITLSDRQIISGVSDRTVLPALNLRNAQKATYSISPGYYGTKSQLAAGMTRLSGPAGPMEPGAWYTPWYPWEGYTSTMRDTHSSGASIITQKSIVSEDRAHGVSRSTLQGLIHAAMPAPLRRVLDVIVEPATISGFGPVGTALKFVNSLGIPLLLSITDNAFSRYGLPIVNEPFDDGGTVRPWAGDYENYTGFVGITHDRMNGTNAVLTTFGDAIHDSVSRGCGTLEKRDCHIEASKKGSSHSTSTYATSDVVVVPARDSVTWMTVPAGITEGVYPALGAFHAQERVEGTNVFTRFYNVGGNYSLNTSTTGAVNDFTGDFGSSYHLISDPAVKGGTRMKIDTVPGDVFEASWDTILIIEAQPAPSLASQVREYAPFVSFDAEGHIVIDPAAIPKLTLIDRYRSEERNRHKRSLYRSVSHNPHPEHEHKAAPIGLFRPGTSTDAEYRARTAAPRPTAKRVVAPAQERKSDNIWQEDESSSWDDDDMDDDIEEFEVDYPYADGPAAGRPRFRSTNAVDNKRRAPPTNKVQHHRVRTVTYGR